MDERIKIFIDNLKKHLEGLSEEEVAMAVGYYEEYLNESLDAGNDLEKAILELGSPEKIAETIRRDTNITRAENNPGVKNFSRVMLDAFKHVTAPLSVFSLSITALISFCMIVLLFGGAVVLGIGAASVLLLCIYQAFTIPFNFLLEILGTLGIGLLGAGIVGVFAFYFWVLGKLFIKLSVKQVRLMLRLSGKAAADPVNNKVKRLWPVTRTLLIITAAGFILFGVSGLPWRFFMIFNSMKPEKLNRVVTEYNTSDIDRISILTAHSVIKVGTGTSDKIVITYEEPDWLEHEITSGGGVLEFREMSNGRLPMFALVTIHESQTELSISLPKGFKADSIKLQGTGSDIFLSDIAENLDVKTLTGDIKYNAGDIKNSILARTKSGRIMVDGVQSGQKSGRWREYDNGMNAGDKVTLTSTSGSIVIE